MVNIVLNAHRGFQNAMPYTPRTLQYMVDLLPKNSLFCVSAIGPAQLPATVNGLLLGAGIVRIGLEDNLYFRQGELATNLQLTERMVRVLREMEYEPATPCGRHARCSACPCAAWRNGRSSAWADLKR